MIAFLHVFWHVLVAVYGAGLVLTWIVTHLVDGYRAARHERSFYPRDGWNRLWTCVFWPLVMVFHRLINVVEFASWAYDHLVGGLHMLGAAFYRKPKK